MEIKPCIDDLITLFVSRITLVVGEIVFCWLFEWQLLIILGLLLMNCLALINDVKLYCYLARTITLEREGCIFSIRGHRKFIPWQELNVQCCDGRCFRFHDSNISGPGILIYPRSAKLSSKLSPMTYCHWRHPLTSVFLRFKPKKPICTGKITHQGFVVERDEIVTFFGLIGKFIL